MSEAEFERLLDTVNAAIAPTPYEQFRAWLPTSEQLAEPANDNDLGWPLLPFPEGWHASC